MSRLHFTTVSEIVLVALMTLGLGAAGTLVTPVVPEPSAPLTVDPKEAIMHAQEGYQVDECVRTIAPVAVLGESAAGEQEFVVLSGAPVMECFPELAEFAVTEGVGVLASGSPSAAPVIPSILFRSSSDLRAILPPPSPPQAVFSQGDVRTSVTVVLPAASSSSAQSATSSAAATTTTDPLSSIPAQEPAISSGGGGSGGAPAQEFPTIDRFDACMTMIFGDAIPETVTEEEAARFEACLAA